jgi:zinc and cadmium transporter
MVLAHIVAATLIAGFVSIFLAAQLSFGALSKIVKQLVSLSVGLLLASAILNVLPAAINSGANVDGLAWTFLISLIFLMCLEKLAVFRHTHHHEGDGHDHHHGHDHEQAGTGGLSILLGDSVHNFADGVMVAAAFMVDIRLGWITAFSVAAHEIPQEIGDFIVLLNAGYSRARALLYNGLSSVAAVLGGVLAYFALEATNAWLPYVLMVTVASFIYVALADLIPSMQASRNWRNSGGQFVLLMLGVGIVVATQLLH